MRGSTMRESVTDVRIILECLQEAYQMEGDMVRSGKNIHATMIYPFVRMLQEKCRDLTEEQIGFVFSVLSCPTEIWNDCNNAFSRRSFSCVDHQQKFH